MSFAGHSHLALRQGVAQEYTGILQDSIQNRRTHSNFHDPLAPQVTLKSYVRREATAAEIDVFMNENNINQAD